MLLILNRISDFQPNITFIGFYFVSLHTTFRRRFYEFVWLNIFSNVLIGSLDILTFYLTDADWIIFFHRIFSAILKFLLSLLLLSFLLCLLFLLLEVSNILDAKLVELIYTRNGHSSACWEYRTTFLQIFEMLGKVNLICFVGFFLLKFWSFGIKQQITIRWGCQHSGVSCLHIPYFLLFFLFILGAIFRCFHLFSFFKIDVNRIWFLPLLYIQSFDCVIVRNDLFLNFFASMWSLIFIFQPYVFCTDFKWLGVIFFLIDVDFCNS